MTTADRTFRAFAAAGLLGSALAFAPTVAATLYVYPQLCKRWISISAYGAPSPEAAGLPALDAACAPWGGSAGGYCLPDGSHISSRWTCFTANNQCSEWTNGQPEPPQFQYIPGYDYDSCVVASSTEDPGSNNGTCSGCAGNPVNFATGNKFQRETDYALTGDALEFYRFYNSRGINNYIPLGMGWTHTWNRVIQLTGGLAAVFRPDGKVWKFNLSGGQWIGNADIPERLVQTAGGWQLTLRNDDIELYDAAGRMLSVTSRDGRVTTLAYSDGTTGGANGGTYDNTSTPFKAGLLIRVTDFQGRVLRFGYANDITLSSVTDPNGGIYRYGYSGGSGAVNQILTSVQYPDGHTRTYQYGEAGAVFSSSGVPVDPVPSDMFWALTGITDDGVRFASYTYWNNGKARSTEHAGGVERYDFSFDTQGTSIYHTPLGAVRTTQNSVILDVVQTNNIAQDCPGCGGTSSESYTYDANRNATSHRDFNGNLQCATFDTARNLETSRTEGLSGAGTCNAPVATSATRTITTQWHPDRRVPQRTAEPLRITTLAYNGDAGVSCAPAGASTALVCSKTVQATTDATGALAFGATADGLGRTWSYTYNASGQVLTVRGPRTDVTDVTTYSYYASNDPAGNFRAGDLQSIANALGQTTQFTNYDAAGRLTRSVDPNALETLITYWPRGWLKNRQVGTAAIGYETTSYTYDAVGNLAQVTTPDGSTVSYTYDAAYRLTDVRDGPGNHIHYTLDNAGNRIAEAAYDITGTLARAHSRAFDVLSRLANDIGGTNPSQQITVNAYDANGNLKTVTDPLSRVTTNVYDNRDRLLQIQDPFNGSASPTSFAYNQRDELTSVTDPNGLATTYTRNGHGELLTQVSPDTGTTTFTYDAGSNLRTKLDARGIQATYTYDALNRVTQITYPDQTVTYSYDSCTNGIGRVCTINDVSGTTSYVYDVRGRVATKTLISSGYTSLMSYAYNSVGHLSTITLPSGKHVVYTYANNRPVSVSVDGVLMLDGVVYMPFGPAGKWRWGNSTPSVPNYHTRAFDLDFRVTRVTSDLPAVNGQPAFDRQIGWDRQGRVATISDLANSALNATYGYDALDRLTSAVQATSTWNYTYNGTGDRLTSVSNGAATNYSYFNGTHRLQQLSGAQSKTFSYDAAGNLTNDGFIYTIGGDNRYTRMGPTYPTINALGQRVKRESGGTTTYFAYDEAGHLWAEYRPADQYTVQETIWLDDLPVAFYQPPAWNFVHTDQLGTPRLVTRRSDNALRWRWDNTEPFGNSAANNDPVGNGEKTNYQMRFPGQYFDATAKSYNYFRDYDASLGRYIESDPIGLKGGLNTYSYVRGNPLRLIDRYGLKSRVCCRGIPAFGNIPRHCYIETNTGTSTTFGLMGGPLTGMAPGIGQTFQDHGFDTGGDCGDWNEDCGTDDCVKKTATNYPNPTPYSLGGPNSNTFAGTIATKCNLKRPAGNAIGWGFDVPGPAEGYPQVPFNSPPLPPNPPVPFSSGGG